MCDFNYVVCLFIYTVLSGSMCYIFKFDKDYNTGVIPASLYSFSHWEGGGQTWSHDHTHWEPWQQALLLLLMLALMKYCTLVRVVMGLSPAHWLA